MRILVLGYIVRGPLGGLAWHHLQYVMGLARLGHDVYFLEDSDNYDSCYNPVTDRMGADPTYGLDFARRAFTRVGLARRWAYHDAHTSQWLGPCGAQARELITSAEILLNVSGVNPLSELHMNVSRRVLIDTDPVFTQLRHLQDAAARARAAQHNVFLTFAENWGKVGVDMPNDGLPWQPTRQPVVLDAWPVTRGNPRGRFTTVMQWESYPPREFDGRLFGTKAHSFAPYLEMPARTGVRFELAIGSPTAPHEELRQHGWLTRDPRRPTRTPWTYQRYIRDSAGEFSVAKQAYAETRCGWFSERSAAYLASGRPVVTQETGFSDWLPTGLGLGSFNSLEEARTTVHDVRARYPDHCRAARQIAEDYFDSATVLTRLLAAAG